MDRSERRDDRAGAARPGAGGGARDGRAGDGDRAIGRRSRRRRDDGPWPGSRGDRDQRGRDVGSPGGRDGGREAADHAAGPPAPDHQADRRPRAFAGDSVPTGPREPRVPPGGGRGLPHRRFRAGAGGLVGGRRAVGLHPAAPPVRLGAVRRDHGGRDPAGADSRPGGDGASDQRARGHHPGQPPAPRPGARRAGVLGRGRAVAHGLRGGRRDRRRRGRVARRGRAALRRERDERPALRAGVRGPGIRGGARSRVLPLLLHAPLPARRERVGARTAPVPARRAVPGPGRSVRREERLGARHLLRARSPRPPRWRGPARVGMGAAGLLRPGWRGASRRPGACGPPRHDFVREDRRPGAGRAGASPAALRQRRREAARQRRLHAVPQPARRDRGRRDGDPARRGPLPRGDRLRLRLGGSRLDSDAAADGRLGRGARGHRRAGRHRTVGPGGPRDPGGRDIRRRVECRVPVPHRAVDPRRLRGCVGPARHLRGRAGLGALRPHEQGGRGLGRALGRGAARRDPADRLQGARLAQAREGVSILERGHHPRGQPVRGGPRVLRPPGEGRLHRAGGAAGGPRRRAWHAGWRR